MKALVYTPNDKIEVIEMPKPDLKSGEVLIKVKLAGICGSDMVAWQGGFARITKPVILGHEFTGEIAEYHDDQAGKLAIGTRVVVEPIDSCGECDPCKNGHYNVCRSLKVIDLDRDGGFAEYVSVPYNRVHAIPDSLTYERAALCEPVTVAIHMIARTGMKFGDKVAIFGAGPIGLLTAVIAKKAGASKIIITDINDYRIALAKELGFEVIDGRSAEVKKLFMEQMGVEGADISFELAANLNTLDMAIDITKIRGTVLAGGIFKKLPTIDLQKITLQEQHLLGTRLYTYSDFDRAIDFLDRDDSPVEKLITRQLGISEAIECGFYAIKNGEDVMKIIINLEK
jgi:(R,R)-butanediol dehydrogenase / meso-butanediol dehydrogenase / diacetyl reductase